MESIYTTNIGQRHKPGPPPPSPGASSPLPPSLWPPLQALAPALAPTQEAPPHPSDRLRLPPRFQASTHTPSVESECFRLRFRLLTVCHSLFLTDRSFSMTTRLSRGRTHTAQQTGRVEVLALLGFRGIVVSPVGFLLRLRLSGAFLSSR